MKLADVRAIKQELLGRFTPLVESARTVPVRARRSLGALGDALVRHEVVPTIALGAAPVDAKGKEFRLAVRVARGESEKVAALVKAAQKLDPRAEIVHGVQYKPRLDLVAGTSVGHFQITAGTLGAFVRDAAGGQFILSNNHVLANCDEGIQGDPILQPGPIDIQGGQFQTIAFLDRYIALSDARVDAALASINDDTVSGFHVHDYPGIGTIDPRPMAKRDGTHQVIKRGRTTAVTCGTVSALDLDGVAINYGTSANPFHVTWNNMIEVVGDPPATPFSDGGDSGSLILDRPTLRPYALLVGGGPDANRIDRTVAHFIGDVLSALNVEFFP